MHTSFDYHSLKINALSSTDGRIECEVELTAEHPHLRGHFVGFPVLPGISQVDLVLHLLARKLGRKIGLTSVQKTKFTALLQPATTFRAAVEFGGGLARWSFQDDRAVYSRGTLTYEPTAEDLA